MTETNPVDTSSPEALRAFCRLCLNPGIGRVRRSPEQFARIMPDWLAEPLAEQVPHLAEHLARISALRDAVELAEAAVTDAQVLFAADLRVWIEGEAAAPAATDEAGTTDEAAALDEAAGFRDVEGDPTR